ncbi:MAG: DUF2339 domain-containing protein [Gemmatimonadetes bacterium]|nr:DUF2339 domain-containing protein [Gemmatimonadota bacterium]
MSESDRNDLEARVRRLERLVESLLPHEPPAVAEPPVTPPRPAPTASAAQERPVSRDTAIPADVYHRPVAVDATVLAERSEQWLGRVGIGFVVLALAFLLKLSFDRGWITPTLRLAFGFGAGIVLLAVGLRLETSRRRLAQTLMGGGVAVLYLVGFAGFQVYHLLPFWVSLPLMTATTVLAIVLGDRQSVPVLSVIGVSGGFATPFLLDTGSGNVGALAIYASIVLLGGGAVQLHKGWLTLLGILVVEGALTLAAMVSAPNAADSLAPFAAPVIYWLVCVASPIGRPRLLGVAPGSRDHDIALWVNRAAALVGTATTVLLFTALLGLERTGAGTLLLAFGAIGAIAALRLRGIRLSQWPAAEASTLCVAVGIGLVAGTWTAMLLIMMESAVLLFLVRRGAPASFRYLGHALAVGVAVLFVTGAETAPPDAFLGLREGALARLAALAMALVAASWAEREAQAYYRGAAYLGLLVWLLSELAIKANGAALVSVTWSLQGASALLYSVKTGSRTLQIGGLATLGLVAAKLLLFDLAQLDPVLRIVLFMGFGAALLALGYWVNRPGASTSAEPEG